MLDGYGIDGAFEQGRGDHLNRLALSGSLSGKLGLNLGADINSDRHAVASFEALPHPNPRLTTGVNRSIQRPIPPTSGP